jgi:hypothetical protein
MPTDGDLGLPERAILLTLMAEAREVSNPELEMLVGTSLTGKSRTKLNSAGLVSSHKVGRSYVHELTEKGWRWCAEELTSEYRPRGSTIGRALYTLLTGLHRYLARSDLRLADVFGPGDPQAPAGPPPLAPASTAPAPVEAPVRVLHLEESIRAAYRKLAREPRDWVLLTQLRPLLGDAPRGPVDEALRQLSRSGRANLVPQANQKTLTDADREAAVRIGNEDCHLISIEDS